VATSECSKRVIRGEDAAASGGRSFTVITVEPGVEGEALVEEPARLLLVRRSEQLKDLPPGGGRHDGFVRERIVEAPELDEDTVHARDIVEVRLSLPE